VIKAAHKESFEVLAISKTDGIDLTKVKNYSEIDNLFNESNPDLVFNATGITDLNYCENYPEQAWMLHARIPALIAAWSNKFNIPWVQVSTDHYYTATENIYHTEINSVNPINEYATSKLAGECLALTSPRALVLRTNIIGKRGWDNQPNFAEWVINNLKNQSPFEGYTDTWASSIEVGQFATLALRMAFNGANGLMNLACSESISKAEWIEKIARCAEFETKNMKKVTTPVTDASFFKRANAMGLDCSKSQVFLNSLGLKLPDSDEVVKALVNSFRSEL
jgi:dTDP-4-dehydrorhamnose reductase